MPWTANEEQSGFSDDRLFSSEDEMEVDSFLTLKSNFSGLSQRNVDSGAGSAGQTTSVPAAAVAQQQEVPAVVAQQQEAYVESTSSESASKETKNEHSIGTIPLELRSRIYEFVIDLGDAEVQALKLVGKEFYYEVTSVQFLDAGISHSWGARYKFENRQIPQKQTFSFKHFEQYKYLATWRQCKFFKPIHRMEFILPSHSSHDDEGQVEATRRQQAMKDIARFFNSLPKTCAQAYVDELSIDFDITVSLEAFNTVETQKVLNNTYRTGYKNLELYSVEGWTWTPSFLTDITNRGTVSISPFMVDLHVFGSAFFLPDIAPWFYALLHGRSKFKKLSLRGIGLPPLDLSKLLMKCQTTTLEKLDLESVWPYDFWHLVKQNPSIKKIEVHFTDKDVATVKNEFHDYLDEPAQLFDLEEIRGRACSVRRLLPLIIIPECRRLEDVVINLDHNADTGLYFDIDIIQSIFTHLASHRIQMARLSVTIPPFSHFSDARFPSPLHMEVTELRVYFRLYSPECLTRLLVPFVEWLRSFHITSLRGLKKIVINLPSDLYNIDMCTELQYNSLMPSLPGLSISVLTPFKAKLIRVTENINSQ
ncbi:hypothetical protein SCHPADRAFT_948065 [Schizopora paradoxa]|uniref:F-box domain-containing protein n=1 Tax=Schizopora paradoxa TaxID=27342 RepID=A0A0H2RGG0_9AGAM|nr:hypothetical protein SCHPADRAFT_948065 [Schizopora paradoxa]